MKLFIDLETVRSLEDPTYNDLVKYGFVKKFTRDGEKTPSTPHEWVDLYIKKAALFAEFGKIICVSMGYVTEENQIVMKSIYGHNEKEILTELSGVLHKAKHLVGHNAMNFDFPWLCRRMVVHQIPIPSVLDVMNKKPWEMTTLSDTAKMWQFGQFNHYTSLATLCELFGIPSPKEGMDGSEVDAVYYIEKNIEKIKTYCEGDVKSLINVYRVMDYLPIIP